MNFIREMWQEGWLGRLVLALSLLLVAFVPVVVYNTHQEQGLWEEYANAHNCTKIGVMQSSPFLISTRLGVGSSSERVGCLCDDGIIYWRYAYPEDNPCNSLKSSL